MLTIQKKLLDQGGSLLIILPKIWTNSKNLKPTLFLSLLRQPSMNDKLDNRTLAIDWGNCPVSPLLHSRNEDRRSFLHPTSYLSPSKTHSFLFSLLTHTLKKFAKATGIWTINGMMRHWMTEFVFVRTIAHFRLFLSSSPVSVSNVE